MDSTSSSKLLAHCPLCQTAYGDAEVRLLGERGSTRLFHCSCRSCGHAMLAVILESQGAVSSVGLVTDLEVQDAMRFRGAAPISADDCVLAHQMLEDESKGFCEALTTKGSG
ncbi:hypothetical protein KJ781_03405 [Patescibacteria group bacterium]|nr:hypothetical protein [Patescibacteria group bacterium]MBU1448875.1 hypothetical protein [Patescibacteria group bacterium]MBU2612911.1 hypothetical protein [Patescibacteria group bacterium]